LQHLVIFSFLNERLADEHLCRLPEFQRQSNFIATLPNEKAFFKHYFLGKFYPFLELRWV